MSPITERLGWVLIHSLWQFCLLSAIAFAFQRILRRARPEIRYAGLLCVLGMVLIVPLTTWTLQSESSAVAQAATSESAGGSIGLPEVLPQDRDDRPSSVGRNSPQIVVPTADSTEPALTETDGRIAQSRTDPPQPTLRETVQVKLKPWLPTIVLGWSIGVLMFAVRPVWSLITIRRLRRQGISAVPENVSALLASTAKRLGVYCVIEVWQSAVVQIPIVAGYLKPVILLPVSVVSGLPASQLEAILAHELAHIRRHDYLVNLLQTLVETICFYHPAVWWLSYQIRCEREHCCDDIAVRALGSPLNYSRALLALEEMRVVQTPLAVGAGGGSLLARVRRLLPSETRHGSQTPGGIAVVGSLLACVLTLAIITTSRESSVEAADERVSFPSPSAESSSWPQLGGSASHNPVSSATGLPTQFDVETRQNIRWSAEIGSWSYSSPVIADGKVLIGANNALGRDPRFPSTVDMACLQCFEEATGEFLWQFSSPRMEQGRRHDWPELSICSIPVVEGDRVWFVTNRCEIICLDLNGHRDGEDDGPELEVSVGKPPYVTSHVADVVWRFDLFNELGVRPLNATCVTPTIAGQLLLLNAPNDVDESYQSLAAPDAPAFLAFDKSAGKLIWSDRTPNSGIIGSGCSMGAPAVGQIEGAWQVVFGGYDGWLYSFDLEGIIRGETKLLWKFDVNPKTATFLLSGPRVGTPVRGVAFTPVISGNHVYAAVGHNPEQGNGSGRLWCIDATKRGDLSPELVYNESAPNVIIPHKRVQACEPEKGDFTRPNPNSGVVWVYNAEDINRDGVIAFQEEFHLSNSLPAIHNGLLLCSDLSGLLHCLDADSGQPLWTHDLMAAIYSGPLIADGKAWLIDEDGDVTVFELSPEKKLLTEVATKTSGYSNLAAANQTLFVATKTQLFAVGPPIPPKPEQAQVAENDRQRLVATLPGGMEVELVGVTRNTALSAQGWAPDGSSIGEIPDWNPSKVLIHDGNTTGFRTEGTPHTDARDLLFEIRGAKLPPSFEIVGMIESHTWSPSSTQDPLRTRLSLLRTTASDAGQKLRLGITDAPWGPYQQVGPDGALLNEPKLTELEQQHYSTIRVDHCGANPNNPSEGELSLQFRGSTLSDENDLGYDFEIRAIGPDGRILTAYPWNSSGILSTTTLQFLTTEHLSAEQIVRWEYRLRPYQHCITFQNISLEPEQNSTRALSVKSLPTSSESGSSQLELLNPDGTRWQGSIVEVQQGYIAPSPAAWSSWSGSNQNIDLSQLPAGQHLLLTRFPPSVMRLTTPLTALPDQTLHRVPLRRGLLPRQHSSSNYSAELSVMRDNQEQETILCELFNNTDELWSFSELDLKLEAGWLGQESEGYSPFWLNDDPTNVPRIEIPARTRSTVRINWNDWAAQGVWDPMAGPQAVSKPALPERQPGKIWVRISGPGFGAIPVSLTHPDQLSQGTAATLPDGSVVELLGVTTPPIAIQPKDQRVWWRADGKILPEPVSNPNNLSVGNERTNGRQAFLRFKTRQHDASMNVRIAGRQEWSSSAMSVSPIPDGEPAQFDLIYVFGPVDDASSATLEVQVATAAWTAWKFDSAGKPLESEETSASLSALREKVEILRAGPSEDGIAIWTRPFSSTTEAAEFKLVAIDKSGNAHFSNRNSGDGNEDFRGYRLNPSEFSHFELRIRPFGPKIRFENVSLQPGTLTKPDVILESTEKPSVSNNAADPNADAQEKHALQANQRPIELKVLDEETGAPVSGAEIMVRNTISDWQPRGQASPDIEPVLSQTMSDAQGRFSVVIPQTMVRWTSNLQLSIRHPEYAIKQSFGARQITSEMAVQPDRLAEKLFGDGVIKLKRGYEISGKVQSPDGSPAVGVRLYAAMQMPEYLNMPPHALTDSSGAYRFRVPDSDGYCLFVIPSDAVAQSIPIQRDYGVHPVLRLERGTEISGRVLDLEGQPLAGVVVQANGSDSIYDGFKEPMARVLTDADGRYELPPQRLPVDVRVAALGWRGGWEERGRDLSLDQVYSPTMVRNPLTTLDFKPCETVILTAIVYDNDGRPAKDCELTVFGFVPGTGIDEDDQGCIWRGRFQEVPEQTGRFQLKAPKGLLNATLRDAEIPAGPRQSWSRAIRNDDDSAMTRTNAGWKVLDSDDNSIIIGQPLSTPTP